MDKSCDACGSTRFRISRFRISDLPRLIVLRYPVRCMRCEQRSHGSLPWVLELKKKQAKKAQARTRS
jgi:hypothetical protein